MVKPKTLESWNEFNDHLKNDDTAQANLKSYIKGIVLRNLLSEGKNITALEAENLSKTISERIVDKFRIIIY